MRLLAIETSGKACSVALFEDDVVIAERHDLIGRGHAEHLLPAIASLPDGGKADSILVGVGPGSFTGIRVGIAAAKGLAIGWSIPVFGMDSLALVALAAGRTGPLFVAIEGGHGELFVKQFVDGEAVGDAVSLTPDAASLHCAGAHVAGNAAARVLAIGGAGDAHDAEGRASLALQLPPSARALAPSPRYVRGPDAKPSL